LFIAWSAALSPPSIQSIPSNPPYDHHLFDRTLRPKIGRYDESMNQLLGGLFRPRASLSVFAMTALLTCRVGFFQPSDAWLPPAQSLNTPERPFSTPLAVCRTLHDFKSVGVIVHANPFDISRIPDCLPSSIGFGRSASADGVRHCPLRSGTLVVPSYRLLAADVLSIVVRVSSISITPHPPTSHRSGWYPNDAFGTPQLPPKSPLSTSDVLWR